MSKCCPGGASAIKPRRCTVSRLGSKPGLLRVPPCHRSPRATRTQAMFEDVVLPESKTKRITQKEELDANIKAVSSSPSSTPCAAITATISETSGYPGFPELLSQSRSSLTGKPIRVVQLPEKGILGGGGGLLGLPFDGLVGTRVLLLDDTNDISSVYHPMDPGRLTGAYWDMLAALDPVLPAEGPLGIFGLGGGTAAVVAHRYWPQRDMVGWELDKEVVDVSREYLGLADLEAAETGRLVVHCEDAFGAKIAGEGGGFAGIFVDLFSDCALLPQMMEVETWENWHRMLRPKGRILANLGGGGDVEQQQKTRAAFQAMAKACFYQVSMREDMNLMALTGIAPDEVLWESSLPDELKGKSRGWNRLQQAPPPDPQSV